MERGDIIICQKEEGIWASIKILEIDTWEDGSETFHCLCYKVTDTKPTKDNINSLEVFVYHAPIDGKEFRENWQVLCTTLIKNEELDGFHYYLKITDFQRYASVTKQDIGLIVKKANEHYQKACSLDGGNNKMQSIEEYSKAIELFPLFYEAIDNRAFTYMEIGNFEQALQDFEESLRVNPDGHHAFFSKGECLLRLGRYEESEKIFLEGVHKFPEHQVAYLKFLEMAKRAKAHHSKQESLSHLTDAKIKSSLKQKPFWKFWD